MNSVQRPPRPPDPSTRGGAGQPGLTSDGRGHGRSPPMKQVTALP